MEEERFFVFVVCGGKDHIDTLNFSLRALRLYSEHPILVITDLERNESDIEHPEVQVINVRTPVEFDNHQASIWLKTSLHRLVPFSSALYCYLDTDVVAVRSGVDDIFKEYVAPISFATDHCRMHQFSPYAVHCGCADAQRAKADDLQSIFEDLQVQYPLYKRNSAIIQGHLSEWHSSFMSNQKVWDLYKAAAPLRDAKDEWFNGKIADRKDLIEKRDRLRVLTDPSQPIWRMILNYLFRVLPNYRRSFRYKIWRDLNGNVLIDEGPDYYSFMYSRGFRFDSDRSVWMDTTGQHYFESEMPADFDAFFERRGFRYNREDLSWYTLQGEFFLPNLTALIERATEYRFNEQDDSWYDGDGNPVFFQSCDHLRAIIRSDLDVDVSDAKWQHWNGGVFLFDSRSWQFMEDWHQFTIQSFGLPNWRTRDQGTLIATVWRHGLSGHPTLPIRFNFIADYQHPTMTYENALTFRLTPESQVIEPAFMHIYHHWGDSEWDVWNDVENHILKGDNESEQ